MRNIREFNSFQWQALEKEDFDSAISQRGIEGLNRDGTLKHSYPDYKWVLVPLRHWNRQMYCICFCLQ